MKFFNYSKLIALAFIMAMFACGDKDSDETLNFINLQTPVADDTITATKVNFSWDKPVVNSEANYSYQLLVSKNKDMSSVTISKLTDKTNLYISAPSNNLYYWKVNVLLDSKIIVSSKVQKIVVAVKESQASEKNEFLFEDFESENSEFFNKEGWDYLFEKGNYEFKLAQYNKNQYFDASIYGASDNEVVTYLVAPEVDLDKVAEKTLQFDIVWHHSADEEFEVLLTQNFNAQESSSINWQPLTFSAPRRNEKFGSFESRRIDLSNYTGKVRIAFKYTGDKTSKTGGFQVDNILIGKQSGEGSGSNSDGVTPLANSPYRDLVFPRNKGQLVEKTYFAFSYVEEHEQAEWVAYVLTDKMTINNVKRNNNFREDYEITTGSASLSDYRGSGYDRGHMCPGGDMYFNYKAMDETFVLSNMSPQIGEGFNRDIWRLLEMRVREIAREEKELVVVTGPVFKNNIRTIGYNKVTVPGYYYKVVLDLTGTKKMYAWLLPHKYLNGHSYDEYKVSVDKVEQETGIDFFSALPDELEESLEAQVQ